MKLVSIIIPVYNAEKSLEKCINSILKQTYKEMEIILVDDGSMDKSPMICDRYADEYENIKVIHKVNGGASSARNKGIECASGEYLQFVDSDDWLEDNYTNDLVTGLIQSNAELVISGYNMVNNGELINNIPEQGIFKGKEDWSKEFGYLYENYFINSPVNKLFIKNKVKKRFPENISLGEDCLFVLSYLNDIQTISLISACGYYYDQNVQGTLTKQYKLEELDIAKLLYSRVKEYSLRTFGRYSGEQEIKYVFLQDFRRHMSVIFTQKNWTYQRKKQEFQKLGKDNDFIEAYDANSKCTKAQKTLFWLLKNGHVNVLMVLMWIYWKNEGKGR